MKAKLGRRAILAAAAFQAARAQALDHGNSIWRRSQPGLHRILLDVSPNAIELRAGSDQMVIAFILPERPMTCPGEDWPGER